MISVVYNGCTVINQTDKQTYPLLRLSMFEKNLFFCIIHLRLLFTFSKTFGLADNLSFHAEDNPTMGILYGP